MIGAAGIAILAAVIPAACVLFLFAALWDD